MFHYSNACGGRYGYSHACIGQVLQSKCKYFIVEAQTTPARSIKFVYLVKCSPLSAL